MCLLLYWASGDLSGEALIIFLPLGFLGDLVQGHFSVSVMRQGGCSQGFWVHVLGSGHAGARAGSPSALGCVCEDPAVGKQEIITGPQGLRYKRPIQEWLHKMHFRVAGER